MKKVLLILCSLVFGLWFLNCQAQQAKITVKNPIDKVRFNEMVEIDAAQLENITTNSFIVTDADGKEIPSQFTYDKKIIFRASVAPKGSSIYHIYSINYINGGKPQTYEPQVFGRYFPERVDDIAWENDKVAFRTYGPALQKNNERAYGFDLWNKRTDKLVVEARYAGELDPNVTAAIKKLREMGKGDLADDVYNAVSYHVDHGNGMDCYKVGYTLGCGTPALMTKEGAIVYPWCWKEYQILDNGPLRFTVKLVYNPTTVDGVQVTETRIVSLDAGSHFNKCTATYEVEGQPSNSVDLTIAAGIVVHKENPNAFVLNEKDGYMGYEDLGDPNQYKEKYRAVQNKDFGQIYVGALFPQKDIKMQYLEEAGLPGANGHILGIQKAQTLTYYFGSGWSRNPQTEFTSLTKWEAYLSDMAAKVRNPLMVKIKK